MDQSQQRHNHAGTFAGLHSHEGGALHWHDEFGEHVAEDLSPEEVAARQLDWKLHHVQLVTVGIDVGSSTTHLMFSRINLQRLGEGDDARFVVVGRQILWKSPVMLTPFVDEETIDAEELRGFLQGAFEAVKVGGEYIDTGAVILTGLALKRKNARAIAELLAEHAGKFVAASAGHHLEAVLAANGSGTVARSRRDGQTLLNVDIGGGTTKFALVQDGEIISTAAIEIGARLIVRDNERRVTRIEQAARRVAKDLGIELRLGEPLSVEDEARLAEAFVDILAGLIDQRPPGGLAAELMLTDPLRTDVTPQAVTFSGGVSEYIFFRESKDFGDLGKPLAKALRGALSNGTISLPAIIDPNLGIRATAIGASQFTVQVGSNLYVSDERILPLRNAPVLVPHLPEELTPSGVAESVRAAMVRADMDEGEQPVAIALKGEGPVDDTKLRALAEGIRDGLPRTIERRVPIVLLVDQPIARSLGTMLKRDLGIPGELVAAEGAEVKEFDFVEVGEVMHPREAVPITVKSLLFAGGLDRRSVKQALLAAATRRS